MLCALYALFDSPIASAHHRCTKAMFNFVVFQELLELVTCEHFGTVSLQDSAEAEVEHPLQDMVDEDCGCSLSR